MFEQESDYVEAEDVEYAHDVIPWLESEAPQPEEVPPTGGADSDKSG